MVAGMEAKKLKHIALQNLSVYYRWKSIRQQQPINNEPKIITPTRYDELELLDGSYSVSDIQDYIEYIKKHEALTGNPSSHVYILALIIH